jgi:NAD(P)H-nitrite reductase large subunit
MADGRLVGALLLGEQQLADPLRELVQQEVDLSAHQEQLLLAGDNLPQLIHRAWLEWKENRLSGNL